MTIKKHLELTVPAESLLNCLIQFRSYFYITAIIMTPSLIKNCVFPSIFIFLLKNSCVKISVSTRIKLYLYRLCSCIIADIVFLTIDTLFLLANNKSLVSSYSVLLYEIIIIIYVAANSFNVSIAIRSTNYSCFHKCCCC